MHPCFSGFTEYILSSFNWTNSPQNGQAAEIENNANNVSESKQQENDRGDISPVLSTSFWSVIL